PSRLWVAEPILTPTGSVADHRLRARAADIPGLAQSILDALGGRGGSNDFVTGVPQDLAAPRGKSIVLVGRPQPAATHVLAHRLNATLGNVGATLTYGESPIFEAGEPSHDLGSLVTALDGGKVKLLIVLEGNPCYGAPGDLELTTRFHKVENNVYLGAYQAEAAVATRWFVPARHYLESWGDARAYDGTVSLIQPLVRPLVPGGRTPIEMLAMVAGVGASNQDLVRGTRKAQRTQGSFE